MTYTVMFYARVYFFPVFLKALRLTIFDSNEDTWTRGSFLFPVIK